MFHVAFGINETELTRALEQRQWNRAENIILDNSGSSFLDEGFDYFKSIVHDALMYFILKVYFFKSLIID